MSTSFEKLPDWKPWPSSLVRAAAAALVGMLALAAVVISWRRVDGGLSRPLGPSALAAVAFAVAALAAAGRAAWSYPRAGRALGGRDWAAALTISAAVVALGVAVGVQGTPPAGLAVLWAVLAIEEFWAWIWGPRRGRKAGTARAPAWSVGWRWWGGRRKEEGRGVQGSGLFVKKAQDSQLSTPNSQPPSAMEQPPDADVLQRLTRSRARGGGETLSGWLRVLLAAGQRSTSVHVAFCPPFARTPKVTLQQLDGPPGRIKTVQLLPYGVRFDIKLAAVSEAAEMLLLEFSAQSEPQRP